MGMIRCDGCTHRFCSIHFNEHRQQLDALFERICNDRDTLCEQINTPRPLSTSNNSLISSIPNEIAEWEHKTVTMVKQTAERARQRVNELMILDNKVAATKLDELSKELRRRKDDDDYFEQDIEKLSKQLQKIQIDVDVQPPHMQINIRSIDWETIIQVVPAIAPCSIYQQPNQLFVGGNLLNLEQQVQLNKFYGNENQKWQLIYKATRDGFDSDHCHECCNRKGPTFTIVWSSDGYIFGGYTKIGWNSNINEWGSDKTSFLFTLINPHDIEPTRYNISSERTKAIIANFRTGSSFGYWDIFIHANSNQNCHSNIHFPSNYVDTTGKGNLTFTGSTFFQTNDIEMYRLIS